MPELTSPHLQSDIYAILIKPIRGSHPLPVPWHFIMGRYIFVAISFQKPWWLPLLFGLSSIASSHTGRSQLKSIYLGLLSNQAASTNCPQELNLVFAGCFLNNIVFSLSFQDAGLFEDDAQFSCVISINCRSLKSGIPVYSLSVFTR